jgi:lipopolysaccharide/colanic/teichoic acid biosynthesis glycosyltransferase
MTMSFPDAVKGSFSSDAIERKRFRWSPRRPYFFPDGVVFGFLFRFIAAFAAVVIPGAILVLFGFFNGWQLTNGLLVFFGVAISSIILIGEHLRSQVYERISSRPSTRDLNDPSRRQTENSENRLSLDHPDFESVSKPGMVKRAFDVVFATLALALIFPLTVLIAALIKMESAGPMVFRQIRRGPDGQPFGIYKFRTMLPDRQMTQSGDFLRRTRFENLPQLLNVLRGDMSLVGQRPRLDMRSEYDKRLAIYPRLRPFKSGITGWAQIHGHPGETPTDLQEIEYDVWYMENWSMWLDISIILNALGLLVTRRVPDLR